MSLTMTIINDFLIVQMTLSPEDTGRTEDDTASHRKISDWMNWNGRTDPYNVPVGTE
jgi:hypothetical protein